MHFSKIVASLFTISAAFGSFLEANDMKNLIDFEDTVADTSFIQYDHVPGGRYGFVAVSEVNGDSDVVVRKTQLPLTCEYKEFIAAAEAATGENADENDGSKRRRAVIEPRASNCGRYCGNAAHCRRGVCTKCKTYSTGDWRKHCAPGWG